MITRTGAKLVTHVKTNIGTHNRSFVSYPTEATPNRQIIPRAMIAARKVINVGERKGMSEIHLAPKHHHLRRNLLIIQERVLIKHMEDWGLMV